MAIDAAMEAVASEATDEVPDHLKDKSYKGAEQLGHGAGYIYTHDHPDKHQEFMKSRKRFYFGHGGQVGKVAQSGKVDKEGKGPDPEAPESA